MIAPDELDRLRSVVGYADNLFGPEGDSGESITFIKITDLRELLRAVEQEEI